MAFVVSKFLRVDSIHGCQLRNNAKAGYAEVLLNCFFFFSFEKRERAGKKGAGVRV